MSIAQEIKRYLSETYPAGGSILATPELAAFFQSQTPKSALPKPAATPVKIIERKPPIVKKAPPPPVATPPPEPAPVVKKEIQQEVAVQTTTQNDSFDDLKKIMRERFPKQVILESTPTAEEWKKQRSYEILVLHETHIAEHCLVLEKLAAALNAKAASAQLIDIGKVNGDKLNGVKLIVAEKSLLQKREHLFVGLKTFAIDSVQELIDQPNKKIALWNGLLEAYTK